MSQARRHLSGGADGQKFRWLFLLVTVFICFTSFITSSNAANKPLELVNIRAVSDNTRIRLIAVFSGNPGYSLQFLDRPSRLVVNLPTVDYSSQTQLPLKLGMVADLRYGSSGPNTSRIILTTTVPFAVENNKMEQLDSGLWQLVIDIIKDNQENFQQLVKKQNDEKRIFAKKENDFVPKPFRVVIDAGHGGIDSGAEGINGTLEKDVTLSFARALRDELEKNATLQVYLTRDSDVFLRLNERVQKARNFGADLFISIHADTINMNAMRGATVYTISDQASDDLARALAERENKADLLDGLPADESPEVTDILIDLARRETLSFSVSFADRVISSFILSDISLIKNPHRYAGFQVLKAPDIPSVLIEIGYLSNKGDEKLITDPVWRKKAASAIAAAVKEFASYRNRQQNNSQP
ncbi:N-acetylmuramoyl-L-alanine amidase [uncultured Bartonella sp.]|uniref:N-acetylmuramoyl-L-alanine amidase n=1 Tax=uncultured Bartonella sp. TaxID=104108 RepID=UPI0026132D63|nr:N-acetylmuramoyl-L-alanine amidase [uncultured Bartonella sp.]